MSVRPIWFLLVVLLLNHVTRLRGNTMETVTSPVAMTTSERGDPAGRREHTTVPAADDDDDDNDDDESKSILYEISDKLFLYAIPVITAVGLVGNTLILIVMRTRSFRRSPVSVFLAALSCADTTVLLLDFLNNWVEVVFHVNFLDSMEWFCKAHRFLFDVCYTYSAWLVAGVAIERCIAVWLPFQAKRFCTVKTSKIVVIVMPVVLSLIYLHNLWGWIKRDDRCDIHDDFQHFQATYGPWVSAVIYSWVPVAILILTNAAIIVQLSRSQQSRKSMGAEKLETLRITVMVVIVCVSFTLLTVPLTLFYIVLFAKQMFNAPSPSMAMGRTVVLILGLSNHAVNFFLYGLSLAKFRLEVRRLFGCRVEERDSSSASFTGATSLDSSTTNNGSTPSLSVTSAVCETKT